MVNTERQNQDESQKRSLQEYTFSLEEAKKVAEDLALKHEQLKRTQELLNRTNEQLKKELSGRKRIESSLRESEEKCRTVLEGTPEPVVVYDMAGRVTYVNPSFTRVFGWSLEECFGKKMDHYVPEETWRETRKMIKMARAGKSFSGVETIRYTKKRSTIHVSISGAIYRDQKGNPVGCVIHLRDITQQKKLETQLEQANKMKAIGTLAGGIAHDFNNILSIIIGNSELALDDVPEGEPVHFNLEEIRTACVRARDIVHQLLSFSRKTDLVK